MSDNQKFEDNNKINSGIAKSSDSKKPALNFLLLSAGSIFTSMIIAGFLVGFAIDSILDTKPLFLLSCGALGFVGGLMKVHRLLGKMDLLEGASRTTNEKKK